MAFKTEATRRQACFRAKSRTISATGRAPIDEAGQKHDHLLAYGCERENLYPAIRNRAIEFFARRRIHWWGSRIDAGVGPTRNLASSQVACVNFLLPLAYTPEALLGAIRAIDSDVADIVPIKHNGNTARVEFEWIGVDRSLEGSRTRGANSTSIDALIIAKIEGGRRAYLLEWKYTEKYLVTKPEFKGEGRQGDTRRGWYSEPFRAPYSSFCSKGPDLDAFLYEPFYQLMRQRLLADRMVHDRELGVTEAKVVVVVPEENKEYRALQSEDGKRVASPPLASAFPQAASVEEVMRSALTHPDRQFAMVAPETLLAGAVAADPGATRRWASYWRKRYGV